MRIVQNPLSWAGRAPVGDGECVALVRDAAELPATADWHKGPWVLTAQMWLPKGTAIATFGPAGRYLNDPNTSHAAIYVEPIREGGQVVGIKVVDQWLGHPPQVRPIRLRRLSLASAKPYNVADNFYVITLMQHLRP